MSSIRWIRALPAIALAAALTSPGAAVASAGDDPQPHSDSLSAAVSDTVITAKVKTRLASDQRLDKSAVSVATTNGVVTLTGTAPSSEASSAAEEVAKSVRGVKSVDNQITAPSALERAAGKLSRAAHATGRAASDEWITTKVKGQLKANRSIQRNSDISVTTSNGVVTLSGTAASRDAFDQAAAVARNVQGVKSVDTSGLRVAGSESAPASE